MRHDLRKIRALNLRHTDDCVWCWAQREFRRTAPVRDAIGTAVVLVFALVAIYLFAAAVDTVWPNGAMP